MPTEIVLLSDVAPAPAVQREVAGRLYPGATHVEYRGGEAGLFASPDHGALLTVHRTKPVQERAEAEAAIADPPAAFGLWTEMTIPFGDAAPGRALAEAIAQAVGGTIRERV